MAAFSRSSNLEEDPLHAYSGLSLFRRTLKSLSISLPKHYQSDDLHQTHTFLESMPFEVKKEHMEQAKAILDEILEEGNGLKDNVVVRGEAEKVRLIHETGVFEFTRSVKKRSHGFDKDLQQDGIELRRSTRLKTSSEKPPPNRDVGRSENDDDDINEPEAMEDLVVLSTSMVGPRNVNESGRFKKIILSPFDIFNFHLCYVQRGLLFPKPDSDIDIISRLKTSLSVTLDRFYPFSGQLVTEEKNGHTVRAFINCDGGGGSGSGVKFVHAEAKTISVIDLVKPGLVNEFFFRSFFPANGIKNDQGVSIPLLMVQVTEIKDGVFIGVGYNSGVADDSSIWIFLKAWSEICSMDSRIETFSSPPLVLKGSVYDGNHQQVYCSNSVIERPCYDSPTSTTILQEIVFHLTKENVLKLKAKANEEIESLEEKNLEISSLHAVLGHVWRFMIKHGEILNLEEKTHCLLPEDTRHIFNTQADFGNLCWTERATVTVQELLDHGLGWAAMKINEGGPKTGTWVNFVEVPVGFGSNSLVVTSSIGFNVYENDFGWGKPVAVRAGPPYLSGRLIVFNGVEEGSLDLQACLPSEVVLNLLKDVEFLEYVNIHLCQSEFYKLQLNTLAM